MALGQVQLLMSGEENWPLPCLRTVKSGPNALNVRRQVIALPSRLTTRRLHVRPGLHRRAGDALN